MVEVSDIFTEPEILGSHRNVRLTVHGRALLVQRVLDHRRPVAHVAKELGISRQCAHRWVCRYRAQGPSGLIDRSSQPRSMPTKTRPEREQAVLAARAQHRLGPARLAALPGVPARTVSRAWSVTTSRGWSGSTPSPATRSAHPGRPRPATSTSDPAT